MRNTLESAARAPRRLDGQHVLALLVAFFGVVFTVNGYFLVRALATHSGVVAVEPYRKGLAYNERIRAAALQAELGWREDIRFTSPQALSVMLTDRDGRPVSGLRLSASVGRPSTGHADRTLEFREESPGLYLVQTSQFEPGAWLVALEARTAEQPRDPIYRAKRRLWLKP